MEKHRFDTIAVTGGFHYDGKTGATNTPLYLTNAYRFDSAEHAANLFDLTVPGYIYTRMHNPTTDVLEARIAALEGGVAAVATATGHFAELAVFADLCDAGDEIVASSRLYGGTMNMLSQTMNKFGIITHFADQNDPASWEALVNERTKIFYFECLANPDSSIPDFEGIIEVAKRHSIPVVVDNTMASPYLFRPGEWGANIVIHSTTKYLCGNGTVMGGVAVDLGNFDWVASGRFPDFAMPDPSYHGMKFTETFGTAAFATRLRVKTMRDMGGTPSPFNSFITLLGIQTLHLRMPRLVETAHKVAEFLSGCSGVASVSYAGLKNHPQHDLALKYFPKGPGALFTFDMKGGYSSAKRAVESLKLCMHASNLGDARTIVTHPASTTHRQVADENLAKAGITKGMLRVSVGLEDAEDIIADLMQALDA